MEFHTNRIDNEDKPLKGLQNDGTIDFVCEDCNKSLLVLQLTSVANVKEAQILTRVVVKCKECGGFSDVKQISGQFHPGAPSDTMIFDVCCDDNAPEHDVIFEAWSK